MAEIEIPQTQGEDGVATINLNSLNADQSAYLEDSGISIARDQGAIRFCVSGNPTTGYTWNQKPELAIGAFTVEETYCQNESPAGFVGVPGTYYFTIKAAAGSAESLGIFALWHGRVWEGEERALEAKAVLIKIV